MDSVMYVHVERSCTCTRFVCAARACVSCGLHENNRPLVCVCRPRRLIAAAAIAVAVAVLGPAEWGVRGGEKRDKIKTSVCANRSAPGGNADTGRR